MAEWSRRFEFLIVRGDHGGYAGALENSEGILASCTSPSAEAVIGHLAAALIYEVVPDERNPTDG